MNGEIGIPKDEVQDMLTTKSELNVFRKQKPRDSSEPNYGCKEILEEVKKIINTKED
mgnify:CR=1 FL=1